MYHAHFGLKELPFSFSPSTYGLFISAGHREGLAALEWGLREPSGFTMLIGEAGTGKTTLIFSLLARDHPGVRTAQIVNPTLGFEEILRSIMEQLGFAITEFDKDRMLQAFARSITQLAPTEKVALILDEAQDLSDQTLEELRLLSNCEVATASGFLQTGPSHKALQIVLVGQPELTRRLKSANLYQLDQRIGARAVLPPLRPEEIYDYIDYRVRALGGEMHHLFKPAALRTVARHSGGIPRRVNVLCHNALLQAFAQGANRVSAKHAQAAVSEYDDLLSSVKARPGRLRESLTHWTHPLSNWMGRAGLALPIAVLAGAALVTTGGWYALRPTTSVRAAALASRPDQVLLERSETEANSRAGETDGVRNSANADAPSDETASAPASEALGKLSPAALPQAFDPQAAAPGSVVVRRGDTLSEIARRYLGAGGSPEINRLMKANPQIMNANRIFPGQTIALEPDGKKTR